MKRKQTFKRVHIDIDVWDSFKKHLWAVLDVPKSTIYEYEELLFMSSDDNVTFDKES